MKNQTLLTLFLWASLTLVSCVTSHPTTATPKLTLPNEFTQGYEPLEHEVADSLDDATVISSPLYHSPLLEVGYIHEDNTVVGVYSDRGVVTGWRVDTTDLAFAYELGIVTSKALTLIGSGKYVIGAREHNFKPNSSNQDIEYVNGIGLWDVRAGNLIKCLSFPCQGAPLPRDGFLGLAVDTDGNQLAVFSETGYSLISIFEDAPSLHITPIALDSPYHWRIGSIVLDNLNSRYIIIFQEGRIHVYEGEKITSYRIIAEGVKGDIIPVTDAQIDPTGRWLVFARGDTTKVLSLDNRKILLEVNVPNPVLAFDETGELLFVGSANKLTIYRVETGEKIAEYDTVGITSLAISEDNRLVIWGDTQGAIHVWAKPLSQP